MDGTSSFCQSVFFSLFSLKVTPRSGCQNSQPGGLRCDSGLQICFHSRCQGKECSKKKKYNTQRQSRARHPSASDISVKGEEKPSVSVRFQIRFHPRQNCCGGALLLQEFCSSGAQPSLLGETFSIWRCWKSRWMFWNCFLNAVHICANIHNDTWYFQGQWQRISAPDFCTFFLWMRAFFQTPRASKRHQNCALYIVTVHSQDICTWKLRSIIDTFVVFTVSHLVP